MFSWGSERVHWELMGYAVTVDIIEKFVKIATNIHFRYMLFDRL